MRLPGHILGQDSDDLLAYCTPKVSYIRDRNIGCLFYCLTFLALSWVIGGQIFWRNEHFARKDVKGITRMWLSHPTRNNCDPNLADCEAAFKPLSTLPYCSQYAGNGKVEHPSECIFLDKHSLFHDGSVGEQIFIPTSMVEIDETKHCSPTSANQFSCDNEYQKERGKGGYYLNETRMKFVANIEDYLIQLTSTYHREHIRGTSLDHPGHYMECFSPEHDRSKKTMSWTERLKSRFDVCPDMRQVSLGCLPGVDCSKRDLKSIEDLEEEIAEQSERTQAKLDDWKDDKIGIPSGLQFLGHDASGRNLRSMHQKRQQSLVSESNQAKLSPRDPSKPEDGDYHNLEVFASPYGDSFHLGKILQIAGINLDGHVNMMGETTRMTGTVLEVEVVYSNLRKFMSSLGFSQVQYTYQMKERMLPYVSKEYLSPVQPDDYPLRRRYIVQHGIMLHFVVGGEFGVFNFVYLLIMLTTAMALLGSAAKITDIVAIYVHPRKRNYFHLKYDVSPDFGDMWECAKCGYLNVGNDYACKGLDKYESALDCKACGHTQATERTQKFKIVGKEY